MAYGVAREIFSQIHSATKMEILFLNLLRLVEWLGLPFFILDGMAKATDNTGRHAAKTGNTRGNTAYYEQLSSSV